MPLVNLDTIDWDSLKLAKSGRAVKLFYNKEPLQICTSSLYTPFGVKSSNKEWSNFTEYYIDCSINSSTTSDSSVTFKTFLEKMDTFLQKAVIENISLFANGKTAIDVENLAYCPMYKGNGDYPKLVKFQLTRDKLGNFESFIFDSQKEKLKLSDNNITDILHKGKVFKSIIECGKIWVYNGKIGSIWNIVQLKMSENKFTQNKNVLNTDSNETNNQTSLYNTLMISD